VNIYYRFSTLLGLYFAYFVVQWFRMFVIYLGLFTQNKRFVTLFEDLGAIIFFYGIALLVTLHAWRFSPAGKLISKDYETMEEKKENLKDYLETWEKTGEMPETGQYIRGQFLLGLVVYLWVGGFFLFIVQSIIALIHWKKYSNVSPSEPAKI
jgi:hypothetical protein